MSERRYAVLIASSRYPREPKLPDLRCPENDVDGFNGILISAEHGEFTETFVLKNVPHQEVLLKINHTLTKARKNDLVLIYYSGHAKLDLRGRLHLATADTVIESLGASSIPVGSIRDYIYASASNQVILVLDCCFSDAVGAALLRGDVDDQLQLVSGGRETYILTSSTGVHRAQEKEGDQHGFLTKHILEGLRGGEADLDGDGRVSMDELHRYVHDRMVKESFQQPMKWDLNIRGELFISRSRKVPREDRRRQIREMLLDLEAKKVLPERIRMKALDVIAMKPAQPSEALQSYHALLEQLAHKRLTVGGFIEEWDKVGSEPSLPVGGQTRTRALQVILEAHRKWLESDGVKGERANLREAHLISVDLRGVPLRGAVLQEANLQGAHLEGADLRGADLRQANLREAHLERADLVEANLHRADLSLANVSAADLSAADLSAADLFAANLQEANLAEAKLQGATLAYTNLQGAHLLNASLEEANLQDAKLTGVTGLLGTQLGGVNLSGFRLPEGIHRPGGLTYVEHLAGGAQKLLLGMMLGCVFAGLTIAMTTDARLLTNSASSPFPFIGPAIPIGGFYLVVPLLLLGFYICFHCYLQRMWVQLAKLPAIFPDGTPLNTQAYPWLVRGLVDVHYARVGRDRTPLSRLQVWMAIFLAYLVIPGTLFFFWGRYLPRHDWVGTGLHIVVLVVSIWVAIMLYYLVTEILRGKAGKLLPWKKALTDVRTYKRTGVALGICGIFYFLSWGAIEGVRTTNFIPTDVRTWVSYALTVNADLQSANLPGADLGGADLRRANLQEAHLPGADLRGADLRGANLMNARGLTREQIDSSLTDGDTRLPDYLIITPVTKITLPAPEATAPAPPEEAERLIKGKNGDTAEKKHEENLLRILRGEREEHLLRILRGE